MMKLIRCAVAAAALWLAALVPAAAQSGCLAIMTGDVLTAAQWNQCFQSKNDFLNFTPLNQAGGVMSGRLITAPPGASLSGLNLTPGTAPASPANGDLWATSGGLFVQINGGTVPLTGAGSASFTASNPLAVTFPSVGVVNYALNFNSSLVLDGSNDLGIDLAHSNAFTAAQSFSGGITVTGSFTATGLVTSADLASSLSLVTPNLNAAIGTSLALGGATISGNALAVTGTALFNNAVTLSAGGTLGGTFSGTAAFSGANTFSNSSFNLTGLGSALTCANSVLLTSSGLAFLGACPGSSASIQQGVTTVTSASGSNQILTTGTVSGGTGTLTNTPFASLDAGGNLNKFRNATFDIWQRGTSVSIASSGNYGPDGWKISWTGASITALRGVFTTPFAVIPGTTQSFLEMVGQASNTDVKVSQRIESAIAAPLAGVPVTFQVRFWQNASGTSTPKLSTCFASTVDNFATCTADLGSTSLQTCATTTWCTLAYTFTPSASAVNGYEIDLDCGVPILGSTACAITAPDIRATPGATAGLNSTPPPPELRPIATELAFCQRYFSTSYGNNVAPGTATHAGMLMASGYGNSSFSFVLGNTAFPAQMRAAPASISFFDGAGTASKISTINASAQSTSFTDAVAIATAPFNISQTGFLWYGGSANALYFFLHYTASAEL